MEQLFSIKKTVFGFLLVFLSLGVQGAPSSVFKWIGGSGQWNNPKHWLQNGSETLSLPGSEDDVIISSTHSSIQIELTDDIGVRSLYTSGDHDVAFYSSREVRISVRANLFLSNFTKVQGKIGFDLVENDEEALLIYPQQVEKKIIVGKKHLLRNTSSLRKSGGCPYFTIVPDPEAPTCNGFSDGKAAVLEPTDGVGPYLYQWIGGPQTRQWNNVGAGTFTVIIIDVGQGGVACNVDVYVNEPGPLTVFAMNAVPPLCADVCNGTASPIVIGGNGGYTFNWSSGENTPVGNSLCSVFTLEITDQKNCTSDTTFTFANIPDTIKFDAVLSQITCFGDGNGAIDLTISGGTGNFTSTWTGPSGFSASTEDISGLQAGVYAVSVTDANNCTADTNFTITQNPQLSATFVKTDNVCAAAMDGAVQVTPAGGDGNYSYAWTGPDGFASTAQNIANLASGLYEVTVTDGAGCTFVMQITIDEPTPVSVNFTVTDNLCAGDATGAVTATASGGSPGYTYSWVGENGFTANGPGISNLHAGAYVLTVSDIENCIFIDTILVNQPDSLHADITVVPITCHNATNGEINTLISGGTPSYAIAWTGPGGFTSSDLDISNLEAGTYSATITDHNNCVITVQESIQNPPPIDLSASVTNGSCASGNSGAIDLSVAGGTTPYTFAWTGPGGFTSTNEDISGLAAGTYTVVVTDAGTCAQTASFTVVAPTALTATFTKQNSSCFGATDGSIQTTPGGGTPPYSYLWIGPSGFFSTNQNISGLTAGSYSLQITDGNGCTGFFTVSITQPSKIQVANTITHVKCFGGSTGAIDITVFGGSGGYTYSWAGPNGFTSSQADINGLEAGAYTITVTDAANCSQSRTLTVNQAGEIIIDATVTDVVCAADTDGEIQTTVTNGVLPLTYAWTGPGGFTASTPGITGLAPGTYNLTVTDANMCAATGSYTLNYTTHFTVDTDVTNISCHGGNDGAIITAVTGGSAPYSISWTGPNGFASSDLELSALEAGTYTLSLADANGCSLSLDIEITEPDLLTVGVIKTDIACAGDNNGTLDLTISGGTIPYTVVWTGPNGFNASNQDISGLEAGTYSLEITDANGCSFSDSYDITEPAPLDLTITATQPGCLTNDGELVATVSGGTVSTDYTWLWEDENGNIFGTNSSITNLPPGDYTLTVTDDNGCSAAETTELNRKSFNVTAELYNVSCHGADDGSINLTPLSGVPPYTFIWIGPDGFTSADPSISALQPGTYDVQIEDAAGCILDLSYDVDQPGPIYFNPVITEVTCVGNGDGSISLQPAGGNPGYLISWAGPNGFSANGSAINGLEQGSYTATITDVNGCVSDSTILLDGGFDFSLSGLLTHPTCHDGMDGSIDLQISEINGSTTGFDFQWTGPGGYTASSEDLMNIGSGDYHVQVSSDEGCVKDTIFSLQNPDEMTAVINVSNANCLQSDGGAGAAVTGGNAPYVFIWMDSDDNTIVVSDTLENVPAGIYSLYVMDSAGCEIQEAFAISDVAGSIDGVVTPPSCSGDNDGNIEITINGAADPLTYEWSDGTTIISDSEDLPNVAAGDYAVVATDANGCMYTATFEIINPAEITGSPSVTLVTCTGNDGAVNLAVQNGAPPYSISWTGPNGYSGAGADINGLEPGTYQYVITDQNNCEVSGSVDVDIVPAITPDAVIGNVLCGGQATGSVSLSVTGGIPPYTFSWTGSDGFITANQNISALSAGDYTVVITDDSGCSADATYTVSENAPIAVSLDILSPDCGIANGSIQANISGGVVAGNYFIQWTDQAGNVLSGMPVADNLPVGIYGLEIADDNGCSYDTTVVLSNPDADISATMTDNLCATDSTGTINLTISGVEEPYTVSWSGPNGYIGTTSALTGLVTGEYFYTVTGNNSCVFTGMVEINSPDPLQISAVIQHTCYGMENGSIEVTVTGGTPEYTLQWQGPDGYTSSDTAINSLPPGLYTLNLSDINGCSLADTIEIIENPELFLQADATNVLCNGDATGSFNVTISGGVPPYAVNWSGPGDYQSTEPSIENLVAGTYYLTVTDYSGCVRDTVLNLTQPDEIAVDQTAISAGCTAEDSPGYIQIVISGGAPDYSVAWTGPAGFTSTALELLNLDAGIYTYQITDMNGCSLTDSIEIFDVDPLVIALSGTPPHCNGDSDGEINTTVSGGLEPYQYAWSGPDGFVWDGADPQGLTAGQYTLIVHDSAGCFTAENIVLSQPDPLVVDVSNSIDASCNTSLDGAVETIVTGGTPPYEYDWTGPNGFTASEANLGDLAAGTYFLSVTDGNGCISDAELIIGFVLEVSADAGEDLSICTSALPAIISGSSINADIFLWTDLSGDSLSTDSVMNFSNVPGTYTLIFTAGNGICQSSDTLALIILPNPEVDAGADQEVFAESVFTLGGNPTSPIAVSYFWSPAAGVNFNPNSANPVASITETTTFEVKVTDANGCIGRDTVLITVIPEINASSGFTPNGDGLNDTWIIDNLELFPDNNVQIFDRWGVILYSQKGYNSGNAWDGTYNGKPLPVGTYYYTIELNDARFPEPMTGPLTIYR